MSLTPPIQTHYDGSFDSVKGESWINHRGIRDCRDRKQALIPKMILAGAVGFEPTNVGFRIRCLNRTWRYPSKWCGRRDSNSHGSHHSDLNAARLPISPRPRPELFPTDVHPKKRGHQQRRCILPRNFVRGGLIRVFTTRHTIFMGCRLFDR